MFSFSQMWPWWSYCYCDGVFYGGVGVEIVYVAVKLQNGDNGEFAAAVLCFHSRLSKPIHSTIMNVFYGSVERIALP